MELIQVTEEIYQASKRLSKSSDALYKLAKEKAEAEREYRFEFAQEIMRLKEEGLQVTLITDVARGNLAEQLYKGDLAESRYKAGVEAVGAIKTQVSSLQTLLKYQTEVSGAK